MTVEIDGANNIVKTNTISEVTSANGVTVDGLNIKDSKLVTADSVIEANMSANSVDSDSYVDGSIDGVHLSSNVITGQTAETSVANDDLVLLSDTSASAGLKKMTVANLVANAGGGKVLQVLIGNTSSTVNNNTQTYATANSLAITPSATSSKILILVSQEWRMETAEAINFQIVRDSTVRVQTETGYVAIASTTESGYWPYKFLDSPSSSSSITYSVKFKATTSGNACSTQTNSTPSSIILLEIGA